MTRVVRAELLDQLPADDPRAAASRLDLVRLNRVMGHTGIARKALIALLGARLARSIVEIGAGDGTFILEVLRASGPNGAGGELSLVDRQDVVSDQTGGALKELGWAVKKVKADVLEYLHKAPHCEVLMANLFLHHFSAEQLRQIFQYAATQARAVIAIEPRRGLLPLVCSRFVGVIGCREVTRHDAPVSVRAGFDGQELSALWPAGGEWSVKERRAGLFSHLFVASRLKATWEH